MSPWEDLDDTSSGEDEDEEEANLCLTIDTFFEESKSYQEDEVNLNDPEYLKKAYLELLLNSSIFSKACKNLQKKFQKVFQRS